MPQSWVPSEVLQLEDDRCCVGYAPSKGRKCLVRIRRDNVKRCNSLLRDLSEQQPDPDLLESKLRRLAQCGLCVRFHQNQVDSMVAQWTQRMRAVFAARSDRIVRATARDELLAPSSRSSPSNPRRSTSMAAPAVVSPTAQSDIETLRTTIATMQAELLAAQRRLDLLAHDSVIPSPSRVSTSDISSLRLSRSTTTTSHSDTNGRRRSETSTNSHGSQPVVHASARSPTATPATSRTQPVDTAGLNTRNTTPVTTRRSTPTSVAETRSAPPPCSSTHVHRLPYSEECSICYDGDDLSTCNSSEVVWCRSGCGRTVHKSCFDEWRARCTLDGRSLRCTICRSDWEPDCECMGGCTREHMRKRAASGDCSICQDELCPSDDNVAEGSQRSFLVWCKSGCGRSVHKECFDAWDTQCRENFLATSCVLCRATWVDECEC